MLYRSEHVEQTVDDVWQIVDAGAVNFLQETFLHHIWEVSSAHAIVEIYFMWCLLVPV